MIEYVVPVRGEYHGRYRLPGAKKVTQVALQTTDKRVAEQRLRKIVRELEDEANGIIAPKALRDGAQRDLREHLAEFVSDLKTRGCAKRYCDPVRYRVTKLLDDCGWRIAADVTADGFTKWRTRQSLAPRTLKHFYDAIRRLLNWMHDQGRIVANPLKGVEPVALAGREKLKRRAFTEDEVSRLLVVAPANRRTLYLMAVLTGLRRSELAALVWGDLHLEAVHLPEFGCSMSMSKPSTTVGMPSPSVPGRGSKGRGPV